MYHKVKLFPKEELHTHPQTSSNDQNLRSDQPGQMGASKVTQPESSNRISNNSHLPEDKRSYSGAINNPPPLCASRLSIEGPDTKKSESEDNQLEESFDFKDINSRHSSFSEESLLHALISTEGRKASLQSGIHIVEGPSSNDLAENRHQIFLEAFVLTNNKVSDEDIINRLNSASPEELLQFTTAFKESVSFLLASSKKEELFTSELPLQRISLIMESILQREQELWCFHNTFTDCVEKPFKENEEALSTTLYKDLEKQFKLSSESSQKNLEENYPTLKQTRFGEYSDLNETRDNLQKIFQSLTKAQKDYSERLLTQKEKDFQVQKLLAETKELTPELAPLVETKVIVSDPSNNLSDHSVVTGNKKPPRFSFNEENEFKEVQETIREDAEKKALIYFQKLFFTALKDDLENTFYQTTLNTLNSKLKSMNLSQGSLPNIPEKAADSGLMTWVWSWVVSPSSSPVPSSPVSTQGQLQTVAKNQEWIKNILSNPVELNGIKTRNPENSQSRVTVLDQLLAKDPALIITAGESTQTSGIEPERKSERKSAWSAVRFGRWLARTEKDKQRYREGIKAARIHIGSKYGPDAIERFDAHFALRYRKGSPLTVRALNEFVSNEEKLLTGDAVSSHQRSQGVIALDLEKISSAEFSPAILDLAQAEFELRYYTYNKEEHKFIRPVLMSLEDQAVLFAAFYQEYLTRPVVIAREVSPAIKGQGFFKARWNAFWSSLSHGNLQKTHQELEEKLTQWVLRNASTTSQLSSEETIKASIQKKLRENKKFTLQEVDDLISETTAQLNENNTWANFFFYRIYKPIVGSVAVAAGVAASAALVVNDSSIAKGAAKAAALGAALYAIGENKPGVQLSTALAALWAANNPKAIGHAENTAVSYIKGTLKYGALTLAAAHFPPLFLALPFV